MERHIFAICAYKESPYLEDCVKSLKGQTVQSQIIMCTSTPCDYIQRIADQYEIPLYVREGTSDIKDDWNFAYNMADADFVTVAHQDDVYADRYEETFQQQMRQYSGKKDVIMYLTDYLPLKDSTGTKRDINSKIRRLLRTPLRSKRLAEKKMDSQGDACVWEFHLLSVCYV